MPPFEEQASHATDCGCKPTPFLIHEFGTLYDDDMEQGDLHHFIVTRFNLGALGDHKAEPPETRFSERWFVSKLVLMKHFAIPSVRAQSERPTWAILVDEESPLKQLELLGETLRKEENTIIIQVDSDWMHKLPLTLSELTDKSWIATTRFDVDDALRSNFCSVVRKKFAEKPRRSVIDLPNGMLFSRRSNVLQSRWKLGNQFLTLIVERGYGRTIYFEGPHADARRRFGECSYEIVETKDPMWILVDHDDNLTRRRKRAAADRPSVSLSQERYKDIEVDFGVALR